MSRDLLFYTCKIRIESQDDPIVLHPPPLANGGGKRILTILLSSLEFGQLAPYPCSEPNPIRVVQNELKVNLARGACG